MTDPLVFARRLVEQGTPVFVARADAGSPTGFRLPLGWQATKCDPRLLEKWMPGDALCAVGGHALDIVDVDPRNGGSVDTLTRGNLLPETYAIVRTPSGGVHFYVAKLGIAKCSRDGIDLQAGAENGTGRGFAFLPGTVRASKVDGVRRPYELAADRLDAFGMNDDTGGALKAWLAEGKAAGGSGDRLVPTDVLSPGAPIPHGEHQKVLFAFACSLRAQGVPEGVAAAAVRHRAEHDCRPPWKGPQDAWEAVSHAYRYEEGEPRETGPLLTLVGAPVEPLHAPLARRAVESSLRVTRGSEMRQKGTRWLWHEDECRWLPLGGMCLLAGREGIGKSTWAYWIAAQISRGLLPGSLFGDPRPVVVCAGEDDWEATILPRFVAAGGDPHGILRVDAETDAGIRGLVLPTDVAALRDLCLDERVGLVLLDPLLGAVAGKLDTHKDSEVRQALEPLSRLAHDSSATVMGLIHLNKSAGDLLTRLMGSRAFAAVARSVLACAAEPTEIGSSGRTFLFGQEKNNLGPRARGAIRYEIEGTQTGYDHELEMPIWSSRIRRLGMVDQTVDELLQQSEAESKMGAPRGKRDAAADFVMERMGMDGAPFADIARDGASAGYSEQTLRRAAKELKVQIVRLPDYTSFWRPAA